MSLKEQALQYLTECKGRWPAVCKRTGVDYQWLVKFVYGRIKEPGVAKIEALLKDRDLETNSNR